MRLDGRSTQIDDRVKNDFYNEEKMIIEYQRPKTIPEALSLLAREQPGSYALGGGTFLNRGMEEQYAVVDLQDLGLGSLKMAGNHVEVGATCTLQEIVDYQGLTEDIYTAIKHETTYNLRQMRTIAGSLVTANGRSPLVTVMLALDTTLEVQELDSAPEQVKLGDWLPMRAKIKPGKLITKITFPINLKIAYEYVARSPADQPIVCAATAQWNSGRTRLALGGWGEAPLLAMDGPEAGGIESAASNAYSQAGDEWASAEYRQEIAGVLAVRGLQRLNIG
jgi:CO/xanthine dehydrogenase FAD-binding subunit